jgi:hypothetical protein
MLSASLSHGLLQQLTTRPSIAFTNTSLKQSGIILCIQLNIKDATSRQVQILITGNYTTKNFIITSIEHNTSIHLSITSAISTRNQILNTGKNQCSMMHHYNNYLIYSFIYASKMQMSNHYQISYSIFSKRIFVSYIKFSTKV